MRILRYIVSGQEIKPSPDCDFKGIVRGTSGYLQVEFVFDKEWDGFLKIAEFRKYLDDEAKPVPIIGNKCMVPNEVTDGRKWRLNVLGKNGSKRLTTNAAEVVQA